MDAPTCILSVRNGHLWQTLHDGEEPIHIMECLPCSPCPPALTTLSPHMRGPKRHLTLFAGPGIREERLLVQQNVNHFETAIADVAVARRQSDFGVGRLQLLQRRLQLAIPDGPIFRLDSNTIHLRNAPKKLERCQIDRQVHIFEPGEDSLVLRAENGLLRRRCYGLLYHWLHRNPTQKFHGKLSVLFMVPLGIVIALPPVIVIVTVPTWRFSGE